LECNHVSRSSVATDGTVPSWLGWELVAFLCTETLFGGNATMGRILGRLHLLSDNPLVDFDFEEVDLLDVKPKRPCAFPTRALLANTVIICAVLCKNPGLLVLAGVGSEVPLVTTEVVAMNGLVSCSGAASSDSAVFELSKEFPVETRSGDVPGGGPSIGLTPNLAILELRSECT
jgi:hypothetical protein